MGFGEGLAAGPFILAAYVVGALLIVGYSVWQILQRNTLRQLERVTREGG
jgi:hypothetical protein